MAKTGSYTDSYGETYKNSYWKVVQASISRPDEAANIVFYGYPSSEKSGKRIIGQKSYALSKKQLDEFFRIAPLDDSTALNAILSNSYKLATETLDVDSGKKDKDGKPVMVSFFDGFADS